MSEEKRKSYKVLLKKENTLAFDYDPNRLPFERYQLTKSLLVWLRDYPRDYIHMSIRESKGEWVSYEDYIGESFIFYDPDVATLFKLTFGG